MSAAARREKIARNFVDRYGADRLAELIEAISRGDSGQVIAERFHVSRERVRQWKNAFGEVITLYQVHREVQGVLDQERAAAR